MVYLETAAEGYDTDSPAVVAQAVLRFDTLRSEALPRAASPSWLRVCSLAQSIRSRCFRSGNTFKEAPSCRLRSMPAMRRSTCASSSNGELIRRGPVALRVLAAK